MHASAANHSSDSSEDATVSAAATAAATAAAAAAAARGGGEEEEEEQRRQPPRVPHSTKKSTSQPAHYCRNHYCFWLSTSVEYAPPQPPGSGTIVRTCFQYCCNTASKCEAPMHATSFTHHLTAPASRTSHVTKLPTEPNEMSQFLTVILPPALQPRCCCRSLAQCTCVSV